MSAKQQSGEGGYVTVADLAIEAVRPGPTGFEMRGRGRDRAEYRLELHLDLPLDQRTRTVLGELLAQSEWRIARRAPHPIGTRPPSRAKRPASEGLESRPGEQP